MANKKARIDPLDYSKCFEPRVHLLGEIVFFFGNLEMSLDLSIWKLLVPEEDTTKRFVMVHAMTAEMTFARKIDAFARMFREKGSDNAESELKALVAKLIKANEERNQLMHSAWVGEGGFMRMKFHKKAKEGSRYQFEPEPVERIKEKRDCIVAASESLMLFSAKYIQPPEPRE